jgi:hypothetical protein
MSKHERLYEHILMRRSDAGVSFESLCALLERLGFAQRIRGDHHVFSKAGIDEILNLQPVGGKAKPYQVRQIRALILQYRLRLEEVSDE